MIIVSKILMVVKTALVMVGFHALIVSALNLGQNVVVVLRACLKLMRDAVVSITFVLINLVHYVQILMSVVIAMFVSQQKTASILKRAMCVSVKMAIKV